MARPRSFDREIALDTATRAFWERGFDGVSIAELSAAIGVGAPSLYAAFGDKRSFFDEAAAHYARGLDAALQRDLSAPTAREAVERLLASSVEHFTGSGQPPGCLVMSEPLLAERRAATRAALRARLVRARDEHELDDEQVEEVAAFADTVLAGLAARARDGGGRDELARAARRAMAAWPE
jgi:AcrR family transcriptional regulator